MEREIHVVLLPWLAFGHMMPFYQLSIALARAGIHVSYISTPKNLKRLPELPPSLAPLIDLVQLPRPVMNAGLLPEDAEATVDVPFEKIQYLKVAYDLLKQPFKQFVAEQSPDWIVVDFSPHWAAEVAQECRVPLMSFYVFSALTSVFFGPAEYLAGDGQRRVRPSPESLTFPPEWVSFPSSVAFRGYEAIGLHADFFGKNASRIADAQRLSIILDACQAVAIRSCREFEGEYLDLFSKITGKLVIPVGLLPPESQSKVIEITGEPWKKIFKWLDEQKPNSVVFVGFGSECKLTKEQVHEIAHGLDVSELPFLWALRKPSWVIDDAEAVPPGFERRTSGRGKVCIGWAPQMEILAHPSIGGSLFHAGWGSAIETLQFGHCLVLLPFIIDQGLNARYLVEKGLAIEVERSEEDGSFSRNDIAKSLRQAMVSKEGERMRAAAREAAAIFGDQKLHNHYVAGLVEFLKNGFPRK